MRTASYLRIALAGALATVSCSAGNSEPGPAGTIIAIERAALERWGNGDPQGYLEIMAPEASYFDPYQERRTDGYEAIKAMLIPIAGKIKVSRFDMQGERVQSNGNVAVLTFNLVSYVARPDGAEMAVARWNSTEVYRQIDGNWKIIHSHWSFIKPELKQPNPEAAS